MRNDNGSEMSGMNVMLLNGHYPKDIRVRKEAESLAENGIPVTVICNWKAGELRSEVVNNVRVIRIGGNASFVSQGIHDVLNAVFFIDWRFFLFARRYLRKVKVHHLHGHDLPMAKTLYLLRRLISGSTIFDMHENFPEMLEERFMVRKSLFIAWKNRLLFSPARWKRFEKRIVPRLDYTIAVVDEMKQKLLDDFPQLSPERVAVVSNYERRDFSIVTEKSDFPFDENCRYVLYVGGISPVRGLETVIEAMKLLQNHQPGIRFLVVGDGNPAYLEQLKQLTRRLAVEKEVTFLGYMNFSRVNYFMQKAAVNIIPHISNGHTNYTIPHKLFQIMLSKAPLLVSDCLPLKRIVESTDGGFIFRASDPDDLAAQILKMIGSPEETGKRVAAAYRAATGIYSWENNTDGLIGLYQRT